MSYRHPRVDNTSTAQRSVMLKTRHDIYHPGFPADPGEHYSAFVRFAKQHVGTSVLDLGCGYGAYGSALMNQGLKCVGCDINLDYLRKAAQHGLPVVNVDATLPFPDGCFDSVLMFEVIEHVTDIQSILKEAFRVARKNVLITVPNSEDIEDMKANDVAYAHMLSSDHVHFFDPASFRKLLEAYSRQVQVERSDPIYPFWFVRRSLPFYALRLLFRLRVLKPLFFTRLYAVASVRQN
jgi:SAM-dependent methyltransferase